VLDVPSDFERTVMDARFTEEDEAFRREIAGWLEKNLRGEFEVVKGRGGPGDEHALFAERHAWEKRMGEADWIGVGWPKAVAGRELSLTQQREGNRKNKLRFPHHRYWVF
jgi:alkylation response protein AidB-like acyl-CoA dehydrogenase